MMSRADLGAIEAMLPCPLGVHPYTGEEYTHVDVEVDSGTEVLNRLPPSPPDRFEREYEENWEGERYLVSEREKTDEEYDREVAAYVRARDEWRRTCGMHAVKVRPAMFTVHAETKSGSTVELLAPEGAQQWHCAAWSVQQKGHG